MKSCHKLDNKGETLIPILLLPFQFNTNLCAVDFNISDAFCILEFSKVVVHTTIGFFVMGFVDFFVKLIFIPINNNIIKSGYLNYTTLHNCFFKCFLYAFFYMLGSLYLLSPQVRDRHWVLGCKF